MIRPFVEIADGLFIFKAPYLPLSFTWWEHEEITRKQVFILKFSDNYLKDSARRAAMVETS
ncbi:MAG: hypothetical protein ACXVB0_00630 [Mucilaginibacter sp.]